MEKWVILIFRAIFHQPWKSTAVYRWMRNQSFKQLFFVSVVFIIPENMSCIHIKQ